MLTARLTDLFIGTCFSHPTPIVTAGIILTASPTVTANNLGIARLTDTVLSFCGHTSTIISASPTATTNNLGNARLGDVVVGSIIGTIIMGSPTVSSV